MKLKITLMLAAGLVIAPLPAAAADDAGKPFSVLAGMGIAGGGDDLAEIDFTNGDSQKLKAGDGLSFYLGFVNEFDNMPLAIQADIGYLNDSTSATNTQARFSRYPINLLLFYINGRHRIGGGVTQHMSPSLDLDNLGGKVEFDDASGYVLEYGYSFFALRYTSIDYDVQGISVDGSSIGLHLVYGF